MEKNQNYVRSISTQIYWDIENEIKYEMHIWLHISPADIPFG